MNLECGVAAVLSDDRPLFVGYLVDDSLGKVLSEPLPLCGRSFQEVLVNVKVINEQRLADPVDNHAERLVAEGQLQQLFNVFGVGYHVHVGHNVDKIVGHLEGGEPGL